ncbi:MAG TPA: peptidase U32 family protein [Candidatus Nanopelagicaceae bacterium]|nr:peptidase U32 family protein [Candidatus Nanopelagicaceae bacterium]
MEKVELLAPVKNFKAIKAASKYADSIYFGIEKFNMRMRSENFALKDLTKITNFCHEHNLKAYLTTNILIYDNELEFLRSIIKKGKESNIDAVIVHDIAAIEIAKEFGMPFHISTQCNVSNSLSARFYENLGAERIILARELSLEKIKEIKRNLHKSEIEVFIHGAMCTSVSGRCYFSQDICGTEEKSANRGSCIQPCRRRWWVREESGVEYIYDGERFMNSRDLCTIAYLPELIEAKVDAFKIEGRMRHPHYVDVVTKSYREAIEAYYDGTFTKKKVGRWVTELKKVYNRGFTPGFYFKRMTEEDHQHKSPTNLSHYRYIKVGQIEKYNQRTGFANITLDNGYLTQNDDIIIMSNNTDTYIHQKAEIIKVKEKEVNKTPRGTKEKPLVVELKVNGKVISNGEDKIYIFTDRTYRKRIYSL